MKSQLRIFIALLLITGILTQGSDSGGENTTTCTDKRDSNTICLQDCEGKLIIWGVLIGMFGLLFLELFIICCLSISTWRCNQYRNLRRKYDDVDGETMPVEEFISKRDNIIENLKRSKTQNNYFYYQRCEKYVVHITSVTIVKQEKPLLTKIQLKGKDHFGTWTGDGSILSNDNQIFMWFYKQYNNRQKAGDWYNLTHESLHLKNKSLEGKWFKKGYVDSNYFSGRWILEFKESQSFHQNQNIAGASKSQFNQD